MRRKYLYIYGGFSFACTTACYDTWRYEIAWAPIAYFGESSSWLNRGNNWKVMHNNKNTGPGARWRH